MVLFFFPNNCLFWNCLVLREEMHFWRSRLFWFGFFWNSVGYRYFHFVVQKNCLGNKMHTSNSHLSQTFFNGNYQRKWEFSLWKQLYRFRVISSSSRYDALLALRILSASNPYKQDKTARTGSSTILFRLVSEECLCLLGNNLKFTFFPKFFFGC